MEKSGGIKNNNDKLSQDSLLYSPRQDSDIFEKPQSPSKSIEKYQLRSESPRLPKDDENEGLYIV